jgi:hypothetical protein
VFPGLQVSGDDLANKVQGLGRTGGSHKIYLSGEYASHLAKIYHVMGILPMAETLGWNKKSLATPRDCQAER